MSDNAAELLLENGLVVTMDKQRRVLEGTSVAIGSGRIRACGPAATLRDQYPSARRLDCTRKAVLPGLVDMHGYLGGSITNQLFDGFDAVRSRGAMEFVVSRVSDEEWWEVEAQMCALERLKLGTTCMFSMMGGNGTRTDDVVFPKIAARELNRVGLRTRIGLGPARPPWPRLYSRWRNGTRSDRMVEFDEVMDNCDRLIAERKAEKGGIVDYWLALSRIGNRNEHDPVWSPEREKWIGRQAEAIRHLMDKHGVGFWTHMYGNAVEYAHDNKLGLLGNSTVLSHCTGLPQRAVDIMRETGTSAGHQPRISRVLSHRCPVPEMIEAGVAVGLGSDTPTNHDCDIFLDMKAAMLLQAVHFKRGDVITPGKALEMATIDGYRALGMDGELGSIEVGKKADVITIDLFQPHLFPVDRPVKRLANNATGRDVRDAVVDGRLVMENRKILTIDEAALLGRAQAMYRKTVERAGFEPFTKTQDGFWGMTH
jgi:cytosine/adenosine deaminase-related metal-dependent hydrolase